MTAGAPSPDPKRSAPARRAAGRPLLLLLALALLGGWLATPATAQTVIEFDTADDPSSRLEFRTVTLPNGAEVELFVLFGSPAVITIDGDQLVGEQIEVDATNRVVRIVGRGSFTRDGETIEGDDLSIALDAEQLEGERVVIATTAIDVVGDRATRMPGQISVLGGSFSPCSRCGQEPEDYGFRAQRLELFPGDRLVAYDVTILVFGQPTVDIPFLVLPLGPEDRRPRLSITSGTDTEPAVVALDWPYVAGATALGTFRVRYYAEIVPDGGSFFAQQLLGGAVEASYLGGGFDHRFFTERGAGELSVFYTPGFARDATDEAPARPQFSVEARFATLPEAGDPLIDLLLERIDERRDRLVEYRLLVSEMERGLRATFLSQNFVDLDPDDDDDVPSYADRSTPLSTVGQLLLAPEQLPLLLGPVRVDALEFDVGAFEDFSNPVNRSAAITPRTTSTRARLRHETSLQLAPWSGFTVSGTNDFRGFYYGTGERLIDWFTRLDARQAFGDAGAFGVSFVRDIAEGETPFRFDRLPLRNRTVLEAQLQLTPLPWLALSSSGGYLFGDTRDPESAGLLPIETRLDLFGNLDWVDLSLANAYDIEEADPGTLDLELSLRAPSRTLLAELLVTHVEDLAATPPRGGGDPVDDSLTTVDLTLGLRDLVVFDAAGGYRYDPSGDDDEDGPWLPLELALEVGTLTQGDALPGLRLRYERDLNLDELSELGFAATATLGPLEVLLEQDFLIDTEGIRSRLAASYPGIARFEVSNLVLLPPGWLDLPFDADAPRTITATLADAPLRTRERWRVAYQTTLSGEQRRNSSVQAQLTLAETDLGGVRFTTNASGYLRLADDSLPLTYLERGRLELTADIYGTVGLQGALAYVAAFDPSQETLSRQTLTIDELTLTVRATPDLYLGAALDDVWELTGTVPSRSPFNFQPTLFVTLDRCCWALYGQWDTATGAITISLTTPGGSDGLGQVFETPLTLPGREETP